MPSLKEEIAANLSSITERIESSAHRAGRGANEITLVAVSKKQPVEKIEALREAWPKTSGRLVLGENYVQEGKKKRELLGDTVSYHLIGPLQSNKIKAAVATFDLIQSVHSLDTLTGIDREAIKIGKIQEVLLQVNISQDSAKSGFKRSVVAEILDRASGLANVRVLGLMTIPRFFEVPSEVRPEFTAMRELRSELAAMGLDRELHLSMGMSDDFEIAIEEGATMIRIGTALFGDRPG